MRRPSYHDVFTALILLAMLAALALAFYYNRPEQFCDDGGVCWDGH